MSALACSDQTVWNLWIVFVWETFIVSYRHQFEVAPTLPGSATDLLLARSAGRC